MIETLRTLAASRPTARKVLTLGLICLLVELAYAIVNVLAMPVFIAREKNLGAQLGLVMGAFLLTESIGRPYLGSLSDRFGRKPLILAGALLSGSASIAIVFPDSLWLLVAIRLLDGFGAAAFWPSLFAAMGDATPSRRRSAGMGVMNVAYMVGLAFGPLAGGWVNEVAGTRENPVYHAAFFLAAGLFALACLMTLVLVPSRYSTPVAAEPEAGELVERFEGFAKLLAAAREVWRLLLLAAIVFFGIGLLIPTVQLYALDKFGITQKEFGELFLIPAVLVGLIAIPLGSLGDVWGRLFSIRVGMAFCAAGLWLVPVVDSQYVLAGGAIFIGVGFLLAFPAWMALVTEVTGEDTRGSVLGAAGLAQGFGAMLGLNLGAYLYHLDREILGIATTDAPFYLAASALSVSLGLTWALGVVRRARAGQTQ